MRIRRNFLNWGVFLVCLGLVPLAVQLGVISSTAAGEIVRLWPLVLVAIGIGLMLRLTRFDVLGVIISSATSGLLIGALLAGGIQSAAVGCAGGPAGGPAINRSGTATGNMRLSVELTCGDMDVTRTAGDAWSVDVLANPAPSIEVTDSSASLRSATNSGFFPFGGRQREQWQVSLPANPRLSASIVVNAGRTRMHLGNGSLSDVSATYNAADGLLDLSGASSSSSISMSSTLNASSVAVILPNAPLNGSMTLNASSLEMCVPPELGLRITYEETISSNNFAQAGMTQSDKTWSTPNYLSAPTRAELHLSANVSSATLNPSGGCQ
jgi:hypothetical protein